MYRLAVDDHKKENGTFICQCYTVNKPETFEKRVEMHEAILYVERNKCSRPLDWIAANESKDIFSNVLAEIINQREDRVLTWANKVDAKTIEENGMPDMFATLECFNPEYNNTFKTRNNGIK